MRSALFGIEALVREPALIDDRKARLVKVRSARPGRTSVRKPDVGRADAQRELRRDDPAR
jgi:hypothetical protein